MKPELAFDTPGCYQIRVRGHLNRHWKDWLDGLDISYENEGITVLTGQIIDQPQLHGLLLKVRDLGLVLISVSEIINERDNNSMERTELNTTKEITIGKKILLPSKILEEDRPILISLPGNYHDGTAKYPVLFHLDGYESLFQLAAGTIRYLAEWEQAIPPMILVAIPNTNRDRDVFPTQATQSTGETIGGGADYFLRFIEAELIPYIDSRYRTLPNRILYGTSNSGLTAVHALLTRPQMFDAFIASSATLSWDENFIFRKANTVFKSWQPTPKFLYLICGKDDIGHIRRENMEFATLLSDRSPANLTWGFDISDEARHCPYRSLHDGLTKLFMAWGYAAKGNE